jgi:hypothetical protein
MSNLLPNTGTPSGMPKGKKVFDISRPGSTPASVNSRPVITAPNSHFQDGIGDISSPTAADKVERAFTRASNPADTHKQLMGAKPRVVIQPAGTLNQDPESRSEPDAPQTSQLIDFDLSSLPGYEHEPVPGESSDQLPSDLSDAPPKDKMTTDEDNLEEAKAIDDQKPAEPKKPSSRQPAWITNAEKDAGTQSETPIAPLPEGLLVVEHTPVTPTNWAWVTIIVVAAIVGIVVLACLAMIIMQVIKG